MSVRTWLITSTTYGTWLPGDSRGSVSNRGRQEAHWSRHNIPQTPVDGPDAERLQQSQAAMRGEPVWLSVDHARLVAAQFQETAAHRGWVLHAFAVTAGHFHVVVTATEETPGDNILRDLKSYASRRLNELGPRPHSGTWWTTSGSKRSLPDDRALARAVNYVLNQQKPLVVWSPPPSGGHTPPEPADLPVTAQNSKPVKFPIHESTVERSALHTEITPIQGADAPRSVELQALDAAHVWHPFTAMSAYVDEHAPVIERGDGFELIDTNGRCYLDGHSSLWCNIHGHRVPEIDAAIRAQLDKVAHSTLLGLSNVPSIELAAELVRRAPIGLNKVFYADCGAAGVEAALKIAWQYHRQKSSGPEDRNLFVCLGSAYHGDTVGTISLGGIDRFHSLFGGLMFEALRVPTPAAPGLSLEACLSETEALLTAHAERIAGFVVEPLVQAAAGILVHPPRYLSAIRALTQRLDIPLIADEIAVGFGRLGTLFACEQEDVSPDILILSKGLTAGYLPLAATLVTDEIYGAFLGDPWAGRTFYHGHTYTGNPLACAAALASLKLIDERDVLGNAREIQGVLSAEFHAPRGCDPSASSVRVRGTMAGIDLRNVETGDAFAPELRVGHRVTLACRDRGVIVRNIGDTLVLMPAPAMPVALVREICGIVRESIDEVTGLSFET